MTTSDEGNHLSGRGLPGIKEPQLKVYQINSLSGGKNGLFVIRHTNKLPDV